MKKTFSDKVRDIVRKIPKGKTMTYKEVAQKLEIRRLHGLSEPLCDQITIRRYRAIASLRATGRCAGTGPTQNQAINASPPLCFFPSPFVTSTE
jgi:hypothetical protein